VLCFFKNTAAFVKRHVLVLLCFFLKTTFQIYSNFYSLPYLWYTKNINVVQPIMMKKTQSSENSVIEQDEELELANLLMYFVFL